MPYLKNGPSNNPPDKPLQGCQKCSEALTFPNNKHPLVPMVMMPPENKLIQQHLERESSDSIDDVFDDLDEIFLRNGEYSVPPSIPILSDSIHTKELMAKQMHSSNQSESVNASIPCIWEINDAPNSYPDTNPILASNKSNNFNGNSLVQRRQSPKSMELSCLINSKKEISSCHQPSNDQQLSKLENCQNTKKHEYADQLNPPQIPSKHYTNPDGYDSGGTSTPDQEEIVEVLDSNWNRKYFNGSLLTYQPEFYNPLVQDRNLKTINTNNKETQRTRTTLQQNPKMEYRGQYDSIQLQEATNFDKIDTYYKIWKHILLRLSVGFISIFVPLLIACALIFIPSSSSLKHIKQLGFVMPQRYNFHGGVLRRLQQGLLDGTLNFHRILNHLVRYPFNYFIALWIFISVPMGFGFCCWMCAQRSYQKVVAVSP